MLGAQASRLPLVDRRTGIVRCRRDYFDFVVERLRRDGTAPAAPERLGSLGAYLKRGRRRVGESAESE